MKMALFLCLRNQSEAMKREGFRLNLKFNLLQQKLLACASVLHVSDIQNPKLISIV